MTIDATQPLAPLAIVTGGSRGLGKVVAKALVAQGKRVVIVSKDPERAAATAQELGCEFRTVDFQDLAATRTVCEEIQSTFGIAEIIVLAHGVMSDRLSKTLRTTTEEWRRVMAINLDSVFVIVNTLCPAMADARNGRVRSDAGTKEFNGHDRGGNRSIGSAGQQRHHADGRIGRDVAGVKEVAEEVAGARAEKENRSDNAAAPATTQRNGRC